MHIDKYIIENKLRRLDFIKCDVEGAELLVFQGAKVALKQFKPAIYCEIDSSYTARLGYTPADLFAELYAHGYHANILTEDGILAVEEYTHAADYLFLQKTNLDNVES